MRQYPRSMYRRPRQTRRGQRRPTVKSTRAEFFDSLSGWSDMGSREKVFWGMLGAMPLIGLALHYYTKEG